LQHQNFRRKKVMTDTNIYQPKIVHNKNSKIFDINDKRMKKYSLWY